MASEFGTGKSIVVLAIVVGCFAILWPKIFYPMMQAAFAITSSDGDERPFRPKDRPPHIQPGVINTKAKKAAEDGIYIKDGKPFPHPSTRQPVKPQPKSGGAMSIVMPIYTIGIVVFFLYTVLKLVFKKPPEGDKKPLIKDFHMDPNYHKFVCQQKPREGLKKVEKPTVSSITEEDEVEEELEEEEETAAEQRTSNEKSGNSDDKDYEIYKLRRKLEETEIAMQRIMQHMGKVSDCLTNACLLKEAGLNSGDILNELSHHKADYRLGTTKPTLRVNKRRKKKVTTPETKPEPIVLSYPSKDLPEKKPDEKPSAEDPDAKLKRDSSINSDNSSFELLSQGMSCSSLTADISDSESVADLKETDLSKSSDVVNTESFEAMDEKPIDSKDAECKPVEDENEEFVESKSDICESKDN